MLKVNEISSLSACHKEVYFTANVVKISKRMCASVSSSISYTCINITIYVYIYIYIYLYMCVTHAKVPSKLVKGTICIHLVQTGKSMSVAPVWYVNEEQTL